MVAKKKPPTPEGGPSKTGVWGSGKFTTDTAGGEVRAATQPNGEPWPDDVQAGSEREPQAKPAEGAEEQVQAVAGEEAAKVKRSRAATAKAKKDAEAAAAAAADKSRASEGNIDGAELVQAVESIERINEEIGALQDDRKEFFDSLKAKGYKVGTVRKAIMRRATDPEKIKAADALLRLYEEALR